MHYDDHFQQLSIAADETEPNELKTASPAP
jgi:hypothetical protein